MEAVQKKDKKFVKITKLKDSKVQIINWECPKLNQGICNKKKFCCFVTFCYQIALQPFFWI